MTGTLSTPELSKEQQMAAARVKFDEANKGWKRGELTDRQVDQATLEYLKARLELDPAVGEKPRTQYLIASTIEFINNFQLRELKLG